MSFALGGRGVISVDFKGHGSISVEFHFMGRNSGCKRRLLKTNHE